MDGIGEKVLDPHRAGANEVILTWADRKDVEHDLTKEVRARLQFVPARTVPWRAEGHHSLIESRLYK